ncbi:hypothetical protein WISP_141802 [Willisornis vidua]|uniref:Uncharacterized protein n=1 Tax=Willisornis vidua TaxID=1566151 RepID=A0ABQ9CR91_9PASS|nr:hypothetical protein WISP_141802 [Willisornis vidua]
MVVVAKVQDPALGLVKYHPIGFVPSIQLVQVSLKSSLTLQQINTPPQLGVICKFANGGLNSLIQIINKDIKQNWAQYSSLENTTVDQAPTECSPIHQQSLGPAIQAVLIPAESTPVQEVGCQLFQEHVMGDSAKGFAEVQIDHIHSLPLIHQAGHPVIKGEQIGETGPATPKFMLAGCDPLSIL